MWLFVGLVLAATLGAVAPTVWPKRPGLALLAVAIIPPLLLLCRYLTFVRENDWEGMGAMAFLVASAGWIGISLTAGAIALRVERKSR
jgi:hypothetical protein